MLASFFLLPKMGIFYKSHIMITYLTFSYFILVLGFNIFIFLTAGNEGDSIARIKFVHHMIHLYIFFFLNSQEKSSLDVFFYEGKNTQISFNIMQPKNIHFCYACVSFQLKSICPIKFYCKSQILV